MSHILNILDPIKKYESITRIQVQSFLPFANSGLKKSDEIRIAVQDQSSFTYPHESYLYIEAKLKDITPATVNEVTLSKNFLLFLFSEIRLELNGHTIDEIRNPGVTVSMKSAVSETYAETAQLSEMGTSQMTVVKNYMIYLCVPMKKLMGIFEDFDKIIIFSPMQLVFVRSRSDKNCIYQQAVAGQTAITDLDIEIIKMAWRLPKVEVIDPYKLRMLKILESGRKVPLFFRTWDHYSNPNLTVGDRAVWQIRNFNPMDKPLFVIVGFQTNRNENIHADMSKFDHCQLRNCRLFLNSQQYPSENLDLDFNNGKYVTAYQMFTEFQLAYYGESGKQKLSMTDYKNDSPLIVFNCSNSDPTIKVSSIDLRIEFEFAAALPNKTVAHCLILYDRVIYYNPFTNLIEKQV